MPTLQRGVDVLDDRKYERRCGVSLRAANRVGYVTTALVGLTRAEPQLLAGTFSALSITSTSRFSFAGFS